MSRVIAMGPSEAVGTILTRSEAARYLKISAAHLSNLARGSVPGMPPLKFSYPGRRMVFRKQWLDDYLEASSVERIPSASI